MSTRRHLTLVAGARPNFMKIAPLIHALKSHNARGGARIEWQLVHTGQHYDRNMSDSFFEDLGIPDPDFNLEVGGGSHAENTGRTMIAFEALLSKNPTGLVVVVGDVNATMACAIVAAKLCIPVAHVEAGLRSFDMSMPEEINRIVTDRISQLLFTTDPSAIEHLRAEGVSTGRVHAVGNVMIDTLLKQKERAVTITRWQEWKSRGPYGLMTLHRPANVDDPAVFHRLAEVLTEVSRELRLIFPRHPRTKAKMEAHGIHFGESITITDPLPYLENLNLLMDARVVLSDSGGLQEETTALGIPCLTMRETTERPVTLEEGTSDLVGSDPEKIRHHFRLIMEGRGKAGRLPSQWDGRAAERIVAILDDWFQKS